jgi:hypothetical protein
VSVLESKKCELFSTFECLLQFLSGLDNVAPFNFNHVCLSTDAIVVDLDLGFIAENLVFDCRFNFGLLHWGVDFNHGVVGAVGVRINPDEHSKRYRVPCFGLPVMLADIHFVFLEDGYDVRIVSDVRHCFRRFNAVGDDGFRGSGGGHLDWLDNGMHLLMNIEVGHVIGWITPFCPCEVLYHILSIVINCHVGKRCLNSLEEFDMVKTEISLVGVRMHILGYVNHFPYDFSFVFLRALYFLWWSGYGIIVMGVGLVSGLALGANGANNVCFIVGFR